MRARQVVREDGPQSHLKKAGTPTMGGVLILLAVTAATLLWAQLNNRFIWLALLTTLAMGAVGFADDYLKSQARQQRGAAPAPEVRPGRWGSVSRWERICTCSRSTPLPPSWRFPS